MHVLLHSAGRISSLFVSSFASSAFPGTEQPRTMASDASWGSFGREMPVEESEVMAQLFGSQSFDQDQDPSAGIQELFWGPDRAAEAYCSSDNSNYDPYSWQQQQASVAGSFLHAAGYNYEGCYSSDPARMAPAISMSSTPVSFCLGRERIDAPPSFFPLDACHHGNQRVCVNEETSSEEVVDSFVKPLPPPPLPPTIEKRPAEGQEDEGQVKSLKRKGRSSSAPAEVKKAQKSEANEEEIHADMNPPPSPCCYSSEDDSNASPEQKGAAAATSSCSKSSADLSQNGKKRASRGSATDPQSLYARKRRDRINERLRILQNLVPNGTKVDISTMLEEAVQYVKFLQLQIKLLSSDELWMYAPIAYNGMNLGFDLKIPPQSQR